MDLQEAMSSPYVNEGLLGARRFLVNDPLTEDPEGIGVRFPSGEVAVMPENVEDVQRWTSLTVMLRHKPITEKDIVWWDEPPEDF